MTARSVPAGASGPWPAPAKLNLFLHITGRRADGYHDLQTLFQFLTLADWLYFEPDPAGALRRIGGLPDVAEADDLCIRAAQLLRRAAGVRAGVNIYIDKRIPAGGGLGGGSSDAATTLLVLNRIWNTGLDISALAGLGLQLGADVPVFVHGHAALAEGVGERLTPLDPPQAWYLVLNPAVSVSTATVFSDAELTRNTPRQTIPDLLSGTTRNDCEGVVRRRYPEVAAALDWLQAFASARMTGSGGCVYAAFASETEAQAVAARVPEQWQALVTRGVNRSPLHTALE